MACPSGANVPIECKGEFPPSSNKKPQNSTLADEVSFKTEYYRKRYEAAKALCAAIADCEPVDACEIMQAALASLELPFPIAELTGIMDAADFWADLAARRELKAYALACFNHLSPADQSAFLAYVKGRAAA